MKFNPGMSNCKILYVCQEVSPYLPDSVLSIRCRALSQGMQEKGNETRTFMPRYGVINERRNQLHEVIRLSGMNLIINNNDHQLIIKVASIPSARVQVYFIDNEDYFQRKAVLTGEDGIFFEDNDERAMFFALGVIETVKKLRWSPDIVHIHGWFAAVVPIFIRNLFADDPLFKNSKVVVSIYDDAFPGELNAGFRKKMEEEGVKEKGLEILDSPTYENLLKFVLSKADGVVFETDNPSQELVDYVRGKEIPFLEVVGDKETKEYLNEYQALYDKVLNH